MEKNIRIFCGFSSRNRQDTVMANILRDVGYDSDHIQLMSTSNKKGVFISTPFVWLTVFVNLLFPLFLFRIIAILIIYDVFFFFAGYSLISFPLRWTWLEFLRYFDIHLLKMIGKKVVYTYQGCDLRRFDQRKPLVCGTCTLRETYCGPSAIRKRQYYQGRVFRNVSHIILTTPDLISFIPKQYHSKVHVLLKVAPLPMGAWRKSVDMKRDKQRPVRVIHAPSNQSIKGTQFIVNAVDLLRKEMQIELELVQGRSRKELFTIARNCDLAIDQLHVGWYGVFAIEMMNIGLPVMCYLDKQAEQRIFENSKQIPIIRTSHNTIVDDLRQALILLDSHLLDEKKAAEVRDYLDEYHSEAYLHKKISVIMMDLGNKSRK